MKAVLTKIVFTLQPGEVVALRMPGNQNLRVEEASGRDVWVTHENKAGDEWLHMPRKPWHVTDGWRHTLAALGWNEHADTPIVAA